MRLTVDLTALYAAVRRMGAQDYATNFRVDARQDPVDQIDIELETGKEVALGEVETKGGLLSYHGRQVLLYIQDHGSNVMAALEDGSQGRKYHVADCRTLQEMRKKNRFERYVATNDLSGSFFISGFDYVTNAPKEGKTSLKVCKNCLKKLNYKGYQYGSKASTFAQFSIEEFFSTYSSFFPHMPRRKAGENDSVYVPGWKEVADSYKVSRGLRCESCGVDLSSHRHLLHVHHKNGVKTDNRRENLEALCVDCHRKQPSHETMFVLHAAMKTITRLRREQASGNASGWEKVFELVDPGIASVAQHCRKKGMPAPEVGYEILDPERGVIAQLELAWPKRLLGVGIADDDIARGRSAGWKVWTMSEALDHC